MSITLGKRNTLVAIFSFILILSLGVGLRLFHLSDVQNVDEPNVIKRAVVMADGKQHVEWYNWPAQSLMRLDAVPIFFLTKYYGLTHHINISSGELYLQKPQPFILAARLITVIFSGISMVVLFFIGKRLQGVWLGLLASFFLSIDYLHTIHSRFATPDVPMVTALLLNLGIAIYIFQRPLSISKKLDKKLLSLFLLSGAITGFALATKYTGLLSLIPICLVFLYSPKLFRSFFPAVGLFLFGLVLSHTLFNPFAWVDWKTIVQDIIFEAKPSRIGVDFGGKGNVFIKNFLYYIKGSFVWNGTFITAVAYITMLWSLVRCKTPRWMLASFISAFYLIILLSLSTLGLHWSRWATPLSVLTVLQAAVGILFFAAWIRKFIPKAFLYPALILGIVIISIPQIYKDVAVAKSTAESGISKQMGLFIKEKIPVGTKIVADTWYLKSKNHTILEKQVDLYETSINEYKQAGVAYAVVKPNRKSYAKRQPEEYKSILTFFADLKKSATLIKVLPSKKCTSVLDHKRDDKVYLWIFSHGLDFGSFCNGTKLELYKL